MSTIGRRNDGSIAVMAERGPVAYANLLEPTKRGTAHNSKDGESEGNARLIAAAPELLAVCRALVASTYAPDGLRIAPARSDVEAMEAAIAKAERRP